MRKTMLQEWKRKGKKFRHVEKDGEETTELSVKIRAAKFRDLPMSLRILIVNLSLFLILCAVFFMAGDRKSTRLNSSHYQQSRMPSSA